MTLNAGTAVIGGILLAAIAGWQYKAANDAQQRVVALERQLSDKRATDLEKAKQSCADRSQHYFTALGYDEAKAVDDMNTTFQNHYNARLGRCLMTLEATSFKGGKEIISKSLIDTDERKSFGEYAWVSSDTKKFYDQKPMQCTMSPPDKPQSRCQSTDEYDDYVKEMLSS